MMKDKKYTLKKVLIELFDGLIDGIYDEDIELDDDTKDSLANGILAYKFFINENKVLFDEERKEVTFPANVNMLRRFVEYKDDVLNEIHIYMQAVKEYTKFNAAIDDRRYQEVISRFNEIIEEQDKASNDVNQVFTITMSRNDFLILSVGIQNLLTNILGEENEIERDRFIELVQLECFGGMISTSANEYYLRTNNKDTSLNDDDFVTRIIYEEPVQSEFVN